MGAQREKEPVAELGIVIGLLALLVGGAAAVAHFAWYEVFAAGWLAIAGGLALGIPTGFLYPVLLRRALLRRGPLPKRWWVNPTGLHRDFDRGEAFYVWMVLGAIGFVISIVGCALVLVGALRA